MLLIRYLKKYYATVTHYLDRFHYCPLDTMPLRNNAEENIADTKIYQTYPAEFMVRNIGRSNI